MNPKAQKSIILVKLSKNSINLSRNFFKLFRPNPGPGAYGKET
jgi:hypothetical protein